MTPEQTNDFIKNAGTIELSKVIKAVLFNRKDKSQRYRSLATNMGSKDFIEFTEFCIKQMLWAKKSRLINIRMEEKILVAEIEELEVNKKK